MLAKYFQICFYLCLYWRRLRRCAHDIGARHVIDQPSSRNTRPSWWLARRPGHECGRCADLSDHFLSVPRHGARLEPVRAEGTGEHLHAHHEPHQHPKLTVFPIAEVAAIGRPLGIPLIVDNTAAPLLVRPFDHGAAVIVYSATKYLGGHGTTLGGLIVDGGNFDWGAFPERQPALNTPDPSYHGAVWSEAVKPLGPIAYIIKARVVLLRDLGAALSPFNAFQIIQGIETLPLRITRHSENAEAVVKFLAARKDVTKVIHPSLAKGWDKELADKYLKGGKGGLVGFELAGGAEAG